MNAVVSSHVLLFLERKDGPTHNPRWAYPLAHQLHRAIIAHWSNRPPVPTWIHGCGATPHASRLSIWPLFDVGIHLADGHLLGFLLAWPSTLPASEQHTMQTVARQITELGHNGRRWVLQVRDPREPQFSPPPKGLTLERWTQPSRVWTTVTPVILDRAPKAKRPHDAWLRLFHNAEVPTPIQIDTHAFPQLEGSVPVRHTIFPSHYHPRPIATHLTCTFREPLAGPLALGRGRFLGLGLLAPLPD